MEDKDLAKILYYTSSFCLLGTMLLSGEMLATSYRLKSIEKNQGKIAAYLTAREISDSLNNVLGYTILLGNKGMADKYIEENENTIEKLLNQDRI